MGASDVVALATQFGTPGLFVGYFIWREHAERRDAREKAKKEHELARARIDADLELARAMTLLTVTIQGKA